MKNKLFVYECPPEWGNSGFCYCFQLLRVKVHQSDEVQNLLLLSSIEGKSPPEWWSSEFCYCFQVLRVKVHQREEIQNFVPALRLW
jgi:hypothetical protein